MSTAKRLEKMLERCYEQMEADDYRLRLPGYSVKPAVKETRFSTCKRMARQPLILYSITKQCTDCQTTFCLSIEEQRDYASHGLDFPDRCRRCRAAYKIQMMRTH